MALLSSNDKTQLRIKYTKNISSKREPISATKPQILSVIDAIDTWVDSNIGNFQSALPAPVRGTAASHVLLANTALIAAGQPINDVSIGIIERAQSAVLLAAYNGASAWFTNNVTGYLTEITPIAGGALTQRQLFDLLAFVCNKRAEM